MRPTELDDLFAHQVFVLSLLVVFSELILCFLWPRPAADTVRSNTELKLRQTGNILSQCFAAQLTWLQIRVHPGYPREKMRVDETECVQ